MTRPEPPSPAARVRGVDRAVLAAAYEQGASLRACGRRSGISAPSVARLLREQGVTIRPPCSYRARADPAALAAAYAAGHTLAEYGQQHGISAPTAARILRENGVTIRPARRSPGTGTRAVLARCRRHPTVSPGRAR
jgi:lambda repressor-like predicted transcriptional regulator